MVDIIVHLSALYAKLWRHFAQTKSVKADTENMVAVSESAQENLNVLITLYAQRLSQSYGL